MQRIMEVDPMPGEDIGRMPFQNFNPCIDKLNDEAEDIDEKVTYLLQTLQIET